MASQNSFTSVEPGLMVASDGVPVGLRGLYVPVAAPPPDGSRSWHAGSPHSPIVIKSHIITA